MIDRAKVEHELARAGFAIAIEDDDERLVLTGLVGSELQRQAVREIVLAVVPEARLVDNLEVLEVLPGEIQGVHLSEAAAGDFPAATPMMSDDEALEPIDFMDRDILENPVHAAGPRLVDTDEETSEGEEVYVPPSDPPVSPEGDFLNGFQLTAMDDDEEEVAPSADGSIGDEALIDAIKRELLEDASTTDPQIEVEVRNRVARLHGRVPSMLDAENAVAVADRVHGVEEVIDAMEVDSV